MMMITQILKSRHGAEVGASLKTCSLGKYQVMIATNIKKSIATTFAQIIGISFKNSNIVILRKIDHSQDFNPLAHRQGFSIFQLVPEVSVN